MQSGQRAWLNALIDSWEQSQDILEGFLVGPASSTDMWAKSLDLERSLDQVGGGAQLIDGMVGGVTLTNVEPRSMCG